MTEACRHCGFTHGPLCPSVKAIEYHPDGTIKRIEYVTAADFPPVVPTTVYTGAQTVQPIIPYVTCESPAFTY